MVLFKVLADDTLPKAFSVQFSRDSQDSTYSLKHTNPIHLQILCMTIFNKSNGSLSFIYFYVIKIVGRDSSVGIATRYGLDGPVIEFRWGRDFPHPPTQSPEVHPTSYVVGTESFQGVKWPERSVNLPPPSSAEVKERVEVYLYSHCGPSCSIILKFVLQLVCFVIVTSFLKCVVALKKKD